MNKLNGNIVNESKNKNINLSFGSYNLFLDKIGNLIIVGNIKNKNNEFFIAKMDSTNDRLIDYFILNFLNYEDNKFNFVKLAFFDNKVYIGSNLSNDLKGNYYPFLIEFDLDNYNANCYIFLNNNNYLDLPVNDVKVFSRAYVFLACGISNFGYIKFNINNPNDSTYFSYDFNDDPIVIYGSIFNGKDLFLLGGEINDKPSEISYAIIHKIKNP